MLVYADYLLFCGETKVGHHLSHLIQSIHNSAHLIKSYSAAIANNLSSMNRAKIHSDLCKSLGLNYNNFRPFESEEITNYLTFAEAEKILWEALEIELSKLL